MQFPQQIVQEIIISYPNGQPAIVLGPGDQLFVYDMSGNLLSSITPTDNIVGSLVKWYGGVASYTPGIGQATVLNDGGIEFAAYPNIPFAVTTSGSMAGAFPASSQVSVQPEVVIDSPTVDASETASQIGLRGSSNDGTVPASISISQTIAGVTNPVPVDLYGVLYSNIGGVGPAARETWHTIALQNGWTTAANFTVPAYKLMPDGTVMLQGSAVSGTPNSIIGILPVGYRPAKFVQFPIAGNDPSPTNSPIINVANNGVMTLVDQSVGASSFSLDGVRFAVI